MKLYSFSALQLCINRVAITLCCCGNETESELPTLKLSSFLSENFSNISAINAT